MRKAPLLAVLLLALVPAIAAAQTAAKVYKAAGPAVAQVKGVGLGAGFVVHPRGVLVTCAHCVDNSGKATVCLADGRELKAKVIRCERDRDVAVLALWDVILAGETLPLLKLRPACDPVRVGETVYALGHPHGMTHSFTKGMVSALGRDLTLKTPFGPFPVKDMIQTDCPINPGNSGGPLLDKKGRVVGVVSAHDPAADGLAYAVSAADVAACLADALGDWPVACAEKMPAAE